MKTVSVIMNTYNEREDYLRKAIESYLSQEKVKVQLIVSTVEGDKNINILQEYKCNIALLEKERHPGKSPVGSYMQINQALLLVMGLSMNGLDNRKVNPSGVKTVARRNVVFIGPTKTTLTAVIWQTILHFVRLAISSMTLPTTGWIDDGETIPFPKRQDTRSVRRLSARASSPLCYRAESNALRTLSVLLLGVNRLGIRMT